MDQFLQCMDSGVNIWAIYGTVDLPLRIIGVTKATTRVHPVVLCVPAELDVPFSRHIRATYSCDVAILENPLTPAAKGVLFARC